MIEEMNYFGASGIPFLFIIDFEMSRPVIIPLDEIKISEILYDINGFRNFNRQPCCSRNHQIRLSKHPLPYVHYREMFDKISEHQMNGDSYLLNLTYPTKIEMNCSLKELFFRSRAKYRLLYNDAFLVFSPETFIAIDGEKISSYPMKGTIDASIPDAANIILNDEKEFSEHITIVDLIRNDLNMVSSNVTVERFRYIERISTSDKDLYQVSSTVTGILGADYRAKIGSIIAALLPAGSVTGAPKKKTVEIIKATEHYERGFYTGICGYFDGVSLDSAVMIRFIENINGMTYYKSGGGITVYSDPAMEYQELIDKVYVPIG